MANWTAANMKQQFKVAETKGWIPLFQKAAKDYKFPVEAVMAVASRETDMRNIMGDGGRGYGLMQIDDRSFPDWCHSGLWKDANASIQMGALVLDQKRESIRNGQGKKLKIKIGQDTVLYTGAADLTPAVLLRTTLAAYNRGMKAYYSLSTRDDPDYYTAHKDYSADALARAAEFKALLRA